MSGHVEGDVNYKVPLFLPCLLCSQKFWPFFSEEPFLQEVEPGIQCPAEDQEWQRSEQWDVWGERQCQEFQCATGRYGPGPAYLVFVPLMWIFLSLYCAFCVVSWLYYVTAAFALYDSLKRLPERGLNLCACFQMCVFAMFPRLYEEGDTAGSPQCNSSICFFNNSAADCISPLVHH